MPPRPLAGYVIGTMALGLAANALDPSGSSALMAGSFILLAIGFLGELAIRGPARR